jgi:hypothetical protein
MGLVEGWVSFPEQPPSLEALAERVAARGGLSVKVEVLGLFDGWYLVLGRLSFACVPGLSVEVSCRSPEKMRQVGRRNVESLVWSGVIPAARLEAPLPPLPPGCVVDVRSYVGVEPTLFYQTLLALEDLGGTLSLIDKPLPDDIRREYDDARQKFGGPVTEAELRRRLRAAQWDFFRKACLVNLLLLPVQLPLFLAELFWELLVRFPRRLRRAQRQLRQRGAPDGTGGGRWDW